MDFNETKQILNLENDWFEQSNAAHVSSAVDTIHTRGIYD